MHKKADASPKVKVLTLVKEDGAYGFVEIEINEDVIKKQGKVTEMCQPDIFAVFMNNITKKCRDSFGI